MRKYSLLTTRQSLIQLIIGGVALYITAQLFGGLTTDGLLSTTVAVFFIQLVQFVLQFAFRFIARVFGVVGMLLSSLLGTGLIVWIVLLLTPGIEINGFGSGLLVAWIYASLLTLLNWVFLTYSEASFIDAVRLGVPKSSIHQTDKTGFIFVQLDGVSYEVLRWQLQTGNLPHIQKLLASEDYTLDPWFTQLPSTTPASQAGILHGSNDNIPAFRWYEKESKELVVANDFSGAALIEKRLSNGHGLLVDGGVSVSNLFSGDAPTNVMVMSKMSGKKESFHAVKNYSWFFTGSFIFMRTIVLSISEMIKELYQAKRQKSKNITPRIDRHGSYVLLRAATNVFLRNLQTTIVIKNMIQGVNSLYVDYLDYDEIAHHAGPARPESLAALSGLDEVVGLLYKAKEVAARPYEIIFVSDHGQSQGNTFKQLHDARSLSDILEDLLGTHVSSQTDPIEKNSSLASIANTKSNVPKKIFSKKFEEESKKTKSEAKKAKVVVTGSGNLGNIWLKNINGRATLKRINASHPTLIDTLLQTTGIGLLIVKDDHEFICMSREDRINLRTGATTGENPLAMYSNYNHEDLYRLARMDTAPDICLISSYNNDTGEVHAFEELVGNHGGLGGSQTNAILLRPQHLKISTKYMELGIIKGSVSIHHIFKDWLRAAGHKR